MDQNNVDSVHLAKASIVEIPLIPSFSACFELCITVCKPWITTSTLLYLSSVHSHARRKWTTWCGSVRFRGSQRYRCDGNTSILQLGKTKFRFFPVSRFLDSLIPLQIDELVRVLHADMDSESTASRNQHFYQLLMRQHESSGSTHSCRCKQYKCVNFGLGGCLVNWDLLST